MTESAPITERRPVGRPPSKPIQGPAVGIPAKATPGATVPEGGAARPVPPSGTPSAQPQAEKGGGDDRHLWTPNGTAAPASGSDKNLPAVASEPPQAPWPSMDTAPKDGKPVWVRDGKGHVVEAVWRQSRKFGMVTNAYGKLISKWSESGFWTLKEFSGVKLPFTPRGWQR